MRFGKTIQERRIKKGFSLRHVAEECGISPTYLSDLEKGKTDTYAQGIIYKIAEVLDLNGDDLVISKGRMPFWVQEFTVKNWQLVKDFIETHSKAS